MNGLQYLIDNKLAEQRERYPDLPEHARIKPMFRDDKPSEVGKCLEYHGHLEGFQIERIVVEGRVIDTRKIVTDVIGRKRVTGSVKRIRTSARVGSADYSATIAGRSVKIEIKIKRDKQSPAQKAYQQEIEAAGGIYLIIRNFQEFYDWYQGFARKEGAI